MFTVCGAPMYAGCAIPTPAKSLRDFAGALTTRAGSNPTVCPGWSIRDLDRGHR
jgi:hypothetical protein